MIARDYTPLMAKIEDEYRRRSPVSAGLNERARGSLVDGGSHTARLIDPFPPRILSSSGAWVQDADGHRILDFWQGHFGNLLGHNPPQITSVLAEAFSNGYGLQSGFTDRAEIELAELICRQTGAEKVRLTTSGTLATMYALLLAKAYTNRDLIMKAGGGWHGAQPWGLKGVGFKPQVGFDVVESAGLPRGIDSEVLITEYNNCDDLHDKFKKHGDQMAAFIVEPFIGAGGCLPARPEYLHLARELTTRHGCLLILDEVIAGFRFRAGDAGSFFGIRPDLATYGKIIGGGMPVSAVAGREDVLAQAGRRAGRRAKFEGGTYSAHPACTLAARTMLGYLVDHEEEIYPRLCRLGDLLRRTVEEAFASEGILARCTGQGNGSLPGSSVNMLVFPFSDSEPAMDLPTYVRNPAACDLALSEVVLQVLLLLEDIHVVHGLGALSTAHSEESICLLGEACRRTGSRIRRYL